MKLKRQFYSRRDGEYTIEDAIIKECEYGLCFEGYEVADDAKHVAERGVEFLAKLTQLLHSKGILSDEEILELLSGYSKIDEAIEDEDICYD